MEVRRRERKGADRKGRGVAPNFILPSAAYDRDTYKPLIAVFLFGDLMRMVLTLCIEHDTHSFRGATLAWIIVASVPRPVVKCGEIERM